MNHFGGYKRVLAISDIHGYLSSLEKLISVISPSNEDLCIFLGDYIDIGPQSYDVVEFLIEFKKTFPQSVFLKGNHEEMFLNYLSGIGKNKFLLNGGYSTLKFYTCDSGMNIPESHTDFYSSLCLYYEYENNAFVHAGFLPGVPFNENTANTMLWIRDEFYKSEYDWGKKIIFGHTPFSRPYHANNKLGINCDYQNKGVICCYEVYSDQFYFSEILV